MTKDLLSKLFEKRRKVHDKHHHAMSKYLITSQWRQLPEVNRNLDINAEEFVRSKSITKLVTLKSGKRRRLSVIRFKELQDLKITTPNILTHRETIKHITFNYTSPKYKHYMTSEEAVAFLTVILKATRKVSTIKYKSAVTLVKKANKIKNECR